MGTPEAPTLLAHEPVTWQHHLRDSIRDGAALLTALGLNPEQCRWSVEAAQQFPVRVPLPFLQRMRFGDPNDPLLRQVLASPDETLPVPGWHTDPLEEAAANPVPGLIHKYQGRVLLLPTSACAINCRYCFRRHFPYADNRLTGDALASAIDYIRADTSLSEVILSGGDPRVLQDSALEQLLHRLAAIPQLQRVRLHSRLPVVIPERITAELLSILSASRLRPIMVIHCNHPNEVDGHLANALNRLRQAGIPLLNQSVLLQGVNDDIETLAALQETLFNVAGVLPYYLHLPDKVAGTAHFEVSASKGQQLVSALRDRLPGYLVPRLAREMPGEEAKRVLAS
jgi:EF-P beta-lysylation protein EpmB